MNREIKFSYIWQHNETGRFVEHIWTLEQLETGTLADQCNYEYRRKHTLVAKRQFIGELDKHGNPVYEGDVCQFYEYPDEPLFFHGLAYIDNDRIGGSWKTIKCNNESLDSSSFWNDDYEKIGNIYENPELLEDK